MKDGVFECVFCAAPLSADWNVGLPDSENSLGQNLISPQGI